MKVEDEWLGPNSLASKNKRSGMTRAVSAPIAFYFHRLGHPGGGAERVICVLANTLSKRGFVVHLISWDGKEARAFYPLNQEVIWHRLGFHPGPIDKLRRSLTLAQLLRDNSIRALVGFVMSGDKTVYAAVKLAGVRLVVAERNAPSMYRLRYCRIQCWLSFALLHLADRIIVQFPDFADGYPVSLRDRIEDIPNPVPVASRHARPNEPNQNGRFTLLAVSRLDGVQKRLDCLLRAFARVAADYPAWDLRIIGDGPLKLEIDSLVIKDRDKLVDYLSQYGTPHILYRQRWTQSLGEQVSREHSTVEPYIATFKDVKPGRSSGAIPYTQSTIRLGITINLSIQGLQISGDEPSAEITYEIDLKDSYPTRDNLPAIINFISADFVNIPFSHTLFQTHLFRKENVRNEYIFLLTPRKF